MMCLSYTIVLGSLLTYKFCIQLTCCAHITMRCIPSFERAAFIEFVAMTAREQLSGVLLAVHIVRFSFARLRGSFRRDPMHCPCAFAMHSG